MCSHGPPSLGTAPHVQVAMRSVVGAVAESGVTQLLNVENQYIGGYSSQVNSEEFHVSLITTRPSSLYDADWVSKVDELAPFWRWPWGAGLGRGAWGALAGGYCRGRGCLASTATQGRRSRRSVLGRTGPTTLPLHHSTWRPLLARVPDLVTSTSHYILRSGQGSPLHQRTTSGRGSSLQAFPAAFLVPFHTHWRRRVRYPCPPHGAVHCNKYTVSVLIVQANILLIEF
ncbi:hypothetical protein E2C01_015713 [Portunus trituberculatus]|uniref:Uncharacterized protein n=1 Tax=Portunus trituberculatus TaxID=210409 RepID=A0A5B7DM94_PORTR|nr:hypothetical protein [Portunus trituberculatus]